MRSLDSKRDSLLFFSETRDSPFSQKRDSVGVLKPNTIHNFSYVFFIDETSSQQT